MLNLMKPTGISLLFCFLAVLCGFVTSTDVFAATVPVPHKEAEEQVFAREISTEWWVLFKSPEISELIGRAFKANPDTETTLMTLRRAQENSVIQRGFFYPNVALSKFPMSNSPGIRKTCTSGQPDKRRDNYNLCIAQLTVGYAPDVLRINPVNADKDQAELLQKAALVTLSSNVAAAAIQESSLRTQIGAQLNIVGLNRLELEIVHNQFKLGYVSEDEVTQRELNAALSQQALVPLQQHFEQTRDLLLALTGNEVDEDRDTVDVLALEELDLPKKLPLSLPSKMVEQRPDVRIAEAQLHSIGARNGLKVVNTLPLFTVTGTTSSPTWMLRDGGHFFDVDGDVAHYIFGATAVQSRSRAAQQALNRVATQYRNVVMAALLDVADTLKIIQSDVRALDTAARAAQSASEAGEQARKNYEAGFMNFENLRAEQRKEQLATIKLAQAQANWLGDSVALFQALGGRWWKRAKAVDIQAKQHRVN